MAKKYLTDEQAVAHLKKLAEKWPPHLSIASTQSQVGWNPDMTGVVVIRSEPGGYGAKVIAEVTGITAPWRVD